MGCRESESNHRRSVAIRDRQTDLAASRRRDRSGACVTAADRSGEIRNGDQLLLAVAFFFAVEVFAAGAFGASEVRTPPQGSDEVFASGIFFSVSL